MYLQCEKFSFVALICCLQQLLTWFPAAAAWSKTLFCFFDFRKRRCVFSVGCCQGVNQNPTPDRQQNSCRLQINVGCNSTAICPRLQLLTASPKTPPSSSQHPTSDSSSALIPDPRPRQHKECVCVILTERMNFCGDSFNRCSNKVLFYSLLLLFVVLSSCEVCRLRKQDLYGEKKKVFTWLSCGGALVLADWTHQELQREERDSWEQHFTWLSKTRFLTTKHSHILLLYS